MTIEEARGIGDNAATAMDEAIAALMKRASARIALEAATLDTDASGRIKPTAANINRINAILDRVSATLFDDQYLAAVERYTNGLNKVSATVTDALKSLGANDTLMNAIAKRAKLDAATALLSPSSFRDLLGSVSAQLINGIVTGAEASAVSQGLAAAVDASGIDRAAKSQVDSAPAAMQRAQTAAASEQAGICFLYTSPSPRD